MIVPAAKALGAVLLGAAVTSGGKKIKKSLDLPADRTRVLNRPKPPFSWLLNQYDVNRKHAKHRQIDHETLGELEVPSGSLL